MADKTDFKDAAEAMFKAQQALETILTSTVRTFENEMGLLVRKVSLTEWKGSETVYVRVEISLPSYSPHREVKPNEH